MDFINLKHKWEHRIPRTFCSSVFVFVLFSSPWSVHSPVLPSASRVARSISPRLCERQKRGNRTHQRLPCSVSSLQRWKSQIWSIKPARVSVRVAALPVWYSENPVHHRNFFFMCFLFMVLKNLHFLWFLASSMLFSIFTNNPSNNP